MLGSDAQIIAFVQKKNDERIALNQSPYRFADLYHSANRTPVSDAGVSYLGFITLVLAVCQFTGCLKLKPTHTKHNAVKKTTLFRLTLSIFDLILKVNITKTSFTPKSSGYIVMYLVLAKFMYGQYGLR